VSSGFQRKRHKQAGTAEMPIKKRLEGGLSGGKKLPGISERCREDRRKLPGSILRPEKGLGHSLRLLSGKSWSECAVRGTGRGKGKREPRRRAPSEGKKRSEG